MLVMASEHILIRSYILYSFSFIKYTQLIRPRLNSGIKKGSWDHGSRWIRENLEGCGGGGGLGVGVEVGSGIEFTRC